jgi:hypothetical protein
MPCIYEGCENTATEYDGLFGPMCEEHYIRRLNAKYKKEPSIAEKITQCEHCSKSEGAGPKNE